MLVRLRLVGGRVSADQLTALMAVAERFGDGRVHVTGRANLQVRGFPSRGKHLADEALTALVDTGLVPSITHDLVRNIMVSPLTGIDGGRAEIATAATELDALLTSDPELATLPGRFLFVLDDGRGDLIERACDLGFVALDHKTVQLRVGDNWGQVVPLRDAPKHLTDLANAFLNARGAAPSEPTAPWHVAELTAPLTTTHPRDPRLPPPSPPLPWGDVAGAQHVEVPEAGLDRGAVDELTAQAPELIVTPWRGLLVPKAPINA